MRCYINPNKIGAISFDLDDTLYDNRPIILRAEAELERFMHHAYPLTTQFKRVDWFAFKRNLLKGRPELCHDTGLARIVVLTQGLCHLGYSIEEAEIGARKGLNCFLKHRSDFTVSKPVLALLQALAQKYPLVGITNGNVDAERIGLDSLLDFVLSPGDGLRMKPAPDMFNIAIDRLNISATNLLHVGDSHSSDVMGARLAGCQSVWLNPGFGVTEAGEVKGSLPHIEISNIEELRLLI
ncbi:HAD-IA family hydrolase [Shewanella sp. D64]|uniref:HAD-IA family hydrolase n=1 Tax=unclassified Shewanella TaxID=196818 RepID=UPI0022BA3781|nr:MULTISPECIES: HAD-IA family hydrolase [unclassified Shewanella]MEC4726168.1 HAD-IA family hydrolase [Shewanella sp. D64]MEC4737916.1 HAD-IA family hydrolase [Shewanella sp. E94]WBJ98068.1 HAD-IA family hydrolase [Shewanella sp. MTB7]